jgi:hypothetical protein
MRSFSDQQNWVGWARMGAIQNIVHPFNMVPTVCRTSSIRLPCMYYFFLAVVVIRYETTATARWTLLFIVRAFFNHTITVAVWTGFHVCTLWGDATTPPRLISAGALLIRQWQRERVHRMSLHVWKNGRRVLAACPWPV